MSSPAFRVRRATVDDLPALRGLWEGMHLPPAELEKRLTEFQVAENAEGRIIAAVGFQIAQRHGLIHSEAFSDFSAADEVRALFWTRLQSLAMNHGVVRLWTREPAPFWSHNGLQAADSETMQRLPAAWDRLAEGWLTLRLKDEDVIASLDKEFEMFVASEKARSADALEQARKLKAIFTVLGFVLALALAGAAVYVMLNQRLPLAH